MPDPTVNPPTDIGPGDILVVLVLFLGISTGGRPRATPGAGAHVAARAAGSVSITSLAAVARKATRASEASTSIPSAPSARERASP